MFIKEQAYIAFSVNLKSISLLTIQQEIPIKLHVMNGKKAI
jgi:hypothetical protein